MVVVDPSQARQVQALNAQVASLSAQLAEAGSRKEREAGALNRQLADMSARLEEAGRRDRWAGCWRAVAQG